MNNAGTGSYSAIIQGIDFTVGQKQSRRRPTVISMSIGGPASDFLNDAVDEAVSQGLVVVAAAGNFNEDACGTSPASAPGSISVGATDDGDSRAYFSNYGNCIDIFAPGSGIKSAGISNNSDDAVMSGTVSGIDKTTDCS